MSEIQIISKESHKTLSTTMETEYNKPRWTWWKSTIKAIKKWRYFVRESQN